ncbi:DUF2252 domain-containing protein [Granulicella tundricola]|uniref:DUF2252 domain-containing protein n=1 Tax=Granulicella tundricola (strain ATCC BAA-1859 / DSM 23138 / MP5ACTX9) TaxID=1198114 RepID=E8WWW2_GRATM|nr:DUF2252 domain-containing protein [Granulicella tundricola]ADW68523.1 Protein of unknown function DUF2252 [Granulicella tundricola MP5ACTX9]
MKTAKHVPADLTHGQKARKVVARSGHQQWSPEHREQSAQDILKAAMRGRIPKLLKLRDERMAATAFGYFRGAVPVMAYDLGRRPHTGILCQLCGDAHVLNLGAYAGYDGSLIFDINDFDETIQGPFEFDVKRLATSLILAGREAGAKEREARAAAAVFLKRYRKSIHLFAALPILEMARYQIHRQVQLDALTTVFAKAEHSSPLHNLDTLTEPAKTKDGDLTASRRFKSNPPILTRLSPAESAPILASLAEYKRTLQPERRHFLAGYRPVDVAFKVVGTGSVGLRAYCIYLEGNGPADPLFLQIKEEPASAWAPYLPASVRPKLNEGRRVENGQRAMQLQSDPFLGYTTIDGRDFLVRQLNDHKASIDFLGLGPAALCHYADLCGELLARGHARSGSSLMIAGYLGKTDRFDKAILRFATAYADQTEHDWKDLLRTRKK